MSPTNPNTGFAPLPRMRSADGDDRRVGVEIEFAGLTEEETARLAAAHLGGNVENDGSHRRIVNGTELGKIEVELDTALKAWGGNRLVDAGLDAARGLIPVEIVTEPLDWPGLDRLDAFRDALRRAGAVGTYNGALLGFGVHFNVAVVGERDPYTACTILAFGLLEDWLRARNPIDTTRRVMPFVEPWPRAFVERLAEDAPAPSMDTIRAAYAEHCNSRNYALDLLPLFKSADPEGFERLFPDQTNTKGRPAFHYRLPDSRIDEPDWSLAREWERWLSVERLADRPDLVSDLASEYRARPQPLLGEADAWADHVEHKLAAAGLA